MENAAMSWLAQFASHSFAEKGSCTVLEAGSDPVHTHIAPWPRHWHTLHALDLQHNSANFSIFIGKEGDTGVLHFFLGQCPFPTQVQGQQFRGKPCSTLSWRAKLPVTSWVPAPLPKPPLAKISAQDLHAFSPS